MELNLTIRAFNNRTIVGVQSLLLTVLRRGLCQDAMLTTLIVEIHFAPRTSSLSGRIAIENPQLIQILKETAETIGRGIQWAGGMVVQQAIAPYQVDVIIHRLLVKVPVMTILTTHQSLFHLVQTYWIRHNGVVVRE